MRTTSTRLWLRFLCASLAIVVTGASSTAIAAASGGTQAGRLADSVPGIPGLPTGVPAAAIAPEPVLPQPSSSEWPFPSDFSHTSGTGLEAGGASLWTDFIYDDHGPLGSPIGIVESAKVTDLAPVHGGYTYPAGPADKNGADIFTAAVGYTKEATYWRVDWNTLANKDVPIAEWTFSTGSSTPAAAEAWPGNAGVRSAGIQYALIVSAQHAQLIYAATKLPVAGVSLETEVNLAARSFIVRIPTEVLPVSGTWQVRLAAGLANSSGTEFETVPPERGGTGSGVNVYNVTFRTYKQEAPVLCPTKSLPDREAFERVERELVAGGEEPGRHLPVVECGNNWMENDQANTLASGDVSKYALTINWSELEAKDETPEPKPTGYSNRWYVSPLKKLRDRGEGSGPGEGEAGQGVVDAQERNTYTGPTYLGQVQPYAVYVPDGYDPSRPTPLSWILHSLGSNLNQYGTLAPSQLKEECEDRDSICATTEGFGDGQWYYEQAQVDFWDVWHALASAYDLNPDATVISGYSMGGFAAYKLGLEYADLFAQAMPLEGPVVCGQRFAGPAEDSAGPGQCTTAGNTTPLIVNGKWLPYVMSYGGIDELVPFPGGLEQVEAFDKLNYRYYAVLYPTEDHMVFATQNNFSPAISQLGHLERVQDPASFTFTWYPELVSSELGLGPTSDYWISGLVGTSAKPGQLATVSASSAALSEAAEEFKRHVGVATGGPSPALTKSLTWSPLASPTPQQQSLRLNLTDIAALSVDTVAAGLKCATITVTSDGQAALTLLRLRPGSTVSENGTTVATALAGGTATVDLSAGTSTVGLCSSESQPSESTPLTVVPS